MAFNKELTVFGGRIVEAGQEAAFAVSLPASVQPYADFFLSAGNAEGIDPFLLVALCLKESGGGTFLTPRGPGGTGDFARRSWAPYQMPPDGGGWGRGLMQIDYGSFSEWLDTHDWTDPETNIRKGAEILARKLKFFKSRGSVAGLTDGTIITVSAAQAQRRNVVAGDYVDPRPLQGELLAQATIAAYNTGEGNVLISVASNKPPDITTTGGNYAAKVTGTLYATVNAFDAVKGRV
jgi:hypothetical protein